MSKRFIETGLFDDDWFMGLSQSGKIGFMYFITKCNHAGILDLNKPLFEFQTGSKWETVRIELGNRLQTLKDGVYFMPKYLQFQYPNFPNSNVKQQKSAIDLLSKYDLIDGENLRVPKGFTNHYDNEHDNVDDNEPENEKPEKFNFRKSLLEIGVSEKIVLEWLKVRKTKKAVNTETAFEKVCAEIKRSGLSANACITKSVENSWAGFKAEWLERDKGTTYTPQVIKSLPSSQDQEPHIKQAVLDRIKQNETNG